MTIRSNCFARWLSLAVILVMGQVLLAQRTITGTISDEQTGEPLIGATVIAVGTNAGAIADLDGGYRLILPEGVSVLEFKYTGYAGKTVTIGVSDVIDVALSPGVNLQEVVVIGYGTTKKEDATGVVAAVSENEMNRGAIVSPDQLLAGKVAGVQITSNSGEPGGQSSIRIRGGTSVNASNEPLYVIDGVPIDNAAHNPGGFSSGRNPLNFINPSDIETFTVLKDASATAIYGSRGANGVIIITTKKGKAGSPGRVSYDGYYTTADVIGQPPVLDAESFRNVVTFAAPERLEQLGEANTNWFDQTVRRSTGHNHSLSFTGGSQNIGYRASLGYQQLEGVLRGSETERTSFSLNLNSSLLHNQLNINANIKGARTTDQFDPGVVGDSWRFDPTQPVFDPDNTAFNGYFEYGRALAPRNPVHAINERLDFGKNYRSLANIEFDYNMQRLIPGLSAKLNLGFDINNGERRRFEPTTFSRPPVTAYTGELRRENVTRESALLEYYMTYKREIGMNHRFDVTGGYSYQDFRGEFPSFRAFDLTSDIFSFNSTNPAQMFEADNSVVQNRLISFFGRANYAFKDRYLFTVTVRRDGSTRFAEANRWGWFPSAAFAWRVMQEDWASSLSNIFYDLKFRLGYGITGNQDIADFGYLPTYSLSDFRALYQFGNAFVTTARPNGYDSNLKWEETSSYNVGVDFAFLRGRLSGSLDYYYKLTQDLLFTVNVPAGTNLTDRVLTNIGELSNQGVELTLNGTAVHNRTLSWNLGFNVAYNRNEILQIDRVSEQGILTGGISGGVGNNIQIIQKGSPINSFFVFRHKIGADGQPLADGIDHNDDGSIDLADIYEDTNGDGMVNDEDKQVFNQPAPDILLGLTSNLYFKNFDLNFTFRGNIGNYVYNNNASNYGYYDRLITEPSNVNNVHETVLETGFRRPQYFSDYYVEDASFLRLDNITLGYTWNPKKALNSVRLYATAQNLFVLTNYTGLDPEVGNGIDNNAYPRARGFIFGISLGL